MIKCSNIEVLKSNYQKNKLAHAFLIETDNKDLAKLDILEFLKFVNCSDVYDDNCSKCNLCHLINTLSLPNLHIIEPDGQAIKKEQIENLKEKMLSIPFISKYNTYIINYAEKLNASSANSMLKFIEEPEPNILGFFITDNRENVISTVKSRCEIIRAMYNTDLEDGLVYYQNHYLDLYNLAIDYLEKVEKEGKKSILNNISLMDEKLERNDLLIIFKIILEVYNSYFQTGTGPEKLSFLSNYNSLQFLKRIKLVIDILDKLNYNSNLNLVLDGFVIRLGEL